MAIKITVDTASELMWIKTVIDNGVLNCGRSMKQLNEDYDLDLSTREVTYSKTENYTIDLPKLAEEIKRREKHGKSRH